MAEDDDDTRMALAQLLELDGYEVVTVPSGADLLDKLASWILEESSKPPADVIVTDVRMPGFNGLNIAEGLRANGWTLPILVMSAFADPEMRRRVRNMGAAALLAKPFDPRALEHAIVDLVYGSAS